MFSALWMKIKGYVAMAGVALAVVVGAFFYGRSYGKADAEAAQAKRDADARKKARGVEDEVQGLDDSAVDERFSRWLRDKR